VDAIAWFKVDDQLAFHPKVLMAGNSAMGLWVRAGSWSGAHLTQGLLPAGMVATLGAHVRDARKLVEVGLWEKVNAGYQFKDWCDYQPSKQQVEGDRAATKERQQRYRDRQSNAVTPPVTEPVTNGVTNGAVTAPPSRPVPKEKEPTSAKPPREDVELLCKRLHDRIEGNGSKAIVTEGWRTAARLMLDRDERDLDKALRLIDWCQDDDFWRGNILSMAKFRAKYDQVRLKASAEVEREPPDAAREWLKAQWKAGTVKAVEERSKLTYAVPDLPDSITTSEQAREFHLAHRRDWITAHADEIIAALGPVAA
jgi:hypothetical protein